MIEKLTKTYVPEPPGSLGSYSPEDVTFLLKDISTEIEEQGNKFREKAIQSGTHYSEMLPIEYQPSPQYIDLFFEALKRDGKKVALATGIVSEQIVAKRGTNLVLVSLARAGTPVGILIKRYLRDILKIDVPHYTISIIRGKGFDKNAVLYILKHHYGAELQFIDGWTGKGAITKVLNTACAEINQQFDLTLNDCLAVLADPGHCVDIFGTREDFLIPSACLNSTVSGLISRTVHRSDLIDENEFHGVKVYKEWKKNDLSNLFVDEISSYFTTIQDKAKEEAEKMLQSPSKVSWEGWQSIRQIQDLYKIDDINLIKPGVGETTRVLLRRVPWMVLVDRLDNPNLSHVLLLAKEKNVSVLEVPGLTYSCCGLIKPMKGVG